MYTALLTAIDLPQDYDHPTIKLLPACPDRVFTLQSFTPAQREVLSLQTETSGSSNSRAKLLPCMKTRRRRSFCLTRGRGETAAKFAVLVHEMAHHLQNSAGKKYHSAGAEAASIISAMSYRAIQQAATG